MSGDIIIDPDSLGDVVRCLNTLVDFYPKHIEKEDKVLFLASRAYFSVVEDQTMLAKFMDFDQKMIHEKYKSVVEELEKQLESRTIAFTRRQEARRR